MPTYNLRIRRAALFVGLTIACLTNPARAADWPMWGYDAARTGVSPEALPTTLYLNWVLKLRAPDPAWHSNQPKVQFDRLYEPVVAGDRMFIGSMVSDRVTAYDTETGNEVWRFNTDGPVRFAPAVSGRRIYFVSDDGYLYCLRTADGALVWKFKGGPLDRKVLGNDRLIDIYPARGAPVLFGGNVYFAASIWPLMGVFIHSLDAETGTVIWTNSGTGSMYIPQQHDVPAFAGITPQGYLAATEDVLLVAGGQTVPAGFDRHTGKLLHFNLHSRRMRTKGGGGYQVRVAKDFFVNRGDIFRLSDGKFLAKASSPILPNSSIVGVDNDGTIFAYERGIKTKPDVDRKGRNVVVATLKLRWREVTTPAVEQIFLMAGSRLYGTTADQRIAAIDVSEATGTPEISWTSQVDGVPLNMIAADGRLFVSTDRGEIYCFGGTPPASGAPAVISELDRIAPSTPAPTPNPSFATADLRPEDGGREFGKGSQWTEKADQLLRLSGTKRGYCLLLGIGSGRLLDELIRQSDLHVVALDPNAKKVADTRRRLDDAGIYGTRAEVFVGDVFTVRLPPYLANVIVSEDTVAAGLSRGKDFAQKIFHSLRPYGGVACFEMSDQEHTVFAAHVSHADIAKAEVARSDRFSTLTRAGALPGSGDWTHHNGDAANSVVSRDKIVRAPLGILWFGGPSNERVLPRHGHGPAPQVVGGRLFIEGAQMLRAVDVYTGLLLWEREFVDLGKYYVSVSHAPGAGAIGGNYVSLEDAVYVINGKTCYYLDAATGKTIEEFLAPPAPGTTNSPNWAFLAVLDDVLIGGVEPYDFTTHAFNTYEMRRYRGNRAKPIRDAIESWKHFHARPIKSGEPEHLYLVDQLNRLLFSKDMLAKIPTAVREAAGARELERELDEHLAGSNGDREVDPKTVAIKRSLLEVYYALPKYQRPPIGGFGNRSHRASRRLIGMDRRTGDVLWQARADGAFRHNTIAAGNGKVFALDRLPAAQIDFLKQRGIEHRDTRRIIAIDLRSGEPIWNATDRIFGTWLGYSVEHNVLLQAGSASGDRALDEVGQGMVAYQGSDGTVLWENDLAYAGPCMLHHDTIFTQAPSGFALDLLTGEKRMRSHPLTGEPVPWSYSRNRGCNTGIASEHIITFRSSAAGFYDLLGDGGTGNLGGFRSGCTSNLIPANGVLNAPDYTRTCTCSYQNRTSLALVPMPDVQIWTFNRYPWDGKRVRQLGVNFGAPGDCRAPNGVLWLDYPRFEGDSPDVPVKIEGPVEVEGPVKVEGRLPEYFRYHPSRIGGADLDWVQCSGIQRASSISITLAKDKMAREQPYTVRLYFAEVDDLRSGERIFDIRLQGKPVLTRFDVIKEAGGRNRGIVKEFRGIMIGSELKLSLEAVVGDPLICGLEVVAEDGFPIRR